MEQPPVDVLRPRDGGLSERLGGLVDGHPVVTFFLAMFGGLLVIAALSIVLGLLVTHVVETGRIGAADERVNVWLAAHRTPTRTDASLIGSIVAGGVVLPIVAGVLALVAALFRKWVLVAFFIFTLAVESATYRATTLVVHSHRPRVHRLEDLPVNASYPSGHTAASIAVYGGLALLITSHFRNRCGSHRHLGGRGRDGRVRRDIAHVPRHASPARRRRRRRRRDRGGVRPRSCLPVGGGGGGMKVAVIAHAGKSFGGGLPELRRVLEAQGIEDPFWVEVPKSKKAPAQVKRALDEGAELVFAWGGDGMVQRCVDVLAGSNVGLAILPAGTANLFASNLGIPQDIEAAVAIGLRGDRRELDVGRFNGERFAVMAGAGFDAAMIRDVGGLKDRFGRAAYVLDRRQEPPPEAVPREDRNRRRRVVQGRGDLHPARERRQALRRPRGVRGRARRRRQAGRRSRDRRTACSSGHE